MSRAGLKDQLARAVNRAVDAFGGHTFQITPEVHYRKVQRLYENAKRDQWNAAVNLPGEDPLDPGELSPVEVTAICRLFSQLYYGERGAQVISGQLCTMAPDNEAAKFLSSQCMDEARHVEVFERLLTRMDGIYPMNPFLNALLTDMKRTNKLEEKLVGMNLLVEGLALSVFKFAVKLFDTDPRYRSEVGHQVHESIRMILRDESRHVGFGMLYLPDLIRALPARRVRELEARQLVWMGLLFGSVRYHKRDAAIVGIPYVDILADILRDHEKRVQEMGVSGIVTGKQLAQYVPVIDEVLDRVTGYEAPVLPEAA
jgi:hypothetical protein